MRDPSNGTRRAPRRAARPTAGIGRRTAVLVVGTALAGAAWLGLVLAAIRFGQLGRDGQGSAWSFMALACVGAVACLFLALLLGWRVTRVIAERRPPSAGTANGGKRPAGRRAKR